LYDIPIAYRKISDKSGKKLKHRLGVVSLISRRNGSTTKKGENDENHRSFTGGNALFGGMHTLAKPV